jgi:hypothetical protein
MRIAKCVFVLGTAMVLSAVMVASAAAAHDPCRVLTAGAFSKVMGYAATIDKTASTEMVCYYSGPHEGGGGQFRILTETASGPQADAMVNRKGSAPPAGSGMVGGTYKEGAIIFSLAIKSTDHSKVDELVAEIKRNLK